jgi:hypothetical protein
MIHCGGLCIHSTSNCPITEREYVSRVIFFNHLYLVDSKQYACITDEYHQSICQYNRAIEQNITEQGSGRRIYDDGNGDIYVCIYIMHVYWKASVEMLDRYVYI